MNRIVDLHMHVVPGIDDGSAGLEESLELLRLSAQQGVRDVFCTSHSGCVSESPELYFKNLKALKDAVISAGIDVQVHKGCEVLCSGKTIDVAIERLKTGVFSTMADSDYVLTELYPDIDLSEALFIVDELKKNNYIPIIAHLERIYTLEGESVEALIQCGALIQINVQSFVDESNPLLRDRARQHLKNRYVHFIGSDGHKIDYRPPNLAEGVGYMLKTIDSDYATEILRTNAERLLIKL